MDGGSVVVIICSKAQTHVHIHVRIYMTALIARPYLDDAVRLVVHRGGGLVQQQNPAPPQERAGQAQQLPLARGEVFAVLRHGLLIFGAFGYIVVLLSRMVVWMNDPHTRIVPA